MLIFILKSKNSWDLEGKSYKFNKIHKLLKIYTIIN